MHAIRLANAVADQARRRMQQATLGHRGRTYDPLYRIRKLLMTAAEQLTERGRARLRAGPGALVPVLNGQSFASPSLGVVATLEGCWPI